MIRITKKEKLNICYICRRSKSDFDDFLGISDIQDQITKLLSNREQEMKNMLNNIITNMQQLLKDSETYPQDLSIKDLLEGETMAQKMTPRYLDLAVYDPNFVKLLLFNSKLKKNETYLAKAMQLKGNYSNFIDEIKNPPRGRVYTSSYPRGGLEINDIFKKLKTIGVIRARIQSVVEKLIKRDISSLKTIDPYLYAKLLELTPPSSKNDNPYYPSPLEYRSFTQIEYTDLSGKNVEEDSNGYFTENPHKYIPISHMMEIKLEFQLCPACAKLFQEASNAALIIEKEKEEYEAFMMDD